MRVVPGYDVPECTNNIRRLVAIEIEVGLGGIRVATSLVAHQHAECDKRVEKIARAPAVDADPFAKRVAIERSRGKDSEDAKLDRAPQGPAPPVVKTQFEH